MAILISFFAKYILAPLIAVTGVFVITAVSKGKAMINMKKMILFILLLGIILALPGFIGVLVHEFVWSGLDLSVILYLSFGALFNLFMKSKAFKAIGFNDVKWIIAIAVFITIVLSAWIYHLVFSALSGLSYSVWCMSFVLWFLVPVFYVRSKEMFVEISAPFYKCWTIEKDINDITYWENIDTFRLMQVTVKIKRTLKASSYSSFSVKLPEDVTIGRWFNRFIEDQNIRFPNDAIEIEGEEGQYSWIFYTSRWFSIPFFTRVIDFDGNVKKNRIKNKSTLYVRRVFRNSEIEDKKG